MQVSVPDVSSKSLAELVSLAGRRAVVTGAGQGLGRAVAERLAEAGADVLVADIQGELAAAVAADLGARGPGRALSAHLDVTESDSVVATADFAVRELGGIDIWVNNAGIFPASPPWRCPTRPSTRCSPSTPAGSSSAPGKPHAG